MRTVDRSNIFLGYYVITMNLFSDLNYLKYILYSSIIKYGVRNIAWGHIMLISLDTRT